MRKISFIAGLICLLGGRTSVYAEPAPRDPAAPRWAEEAKELDLAEVRWRPALSDARLSSYTTMATWCASCRRELPQFETLKARFEPAELRLFAVAIDAEDSPEKLASYLEQHRPQYELLGDLPPEERLLLRQVIINQLGVDGLPATVVTRADGRVVHVQAGVPTISRIRRLLQQEEQG